MSTRTVHQCQCKVCKNDNDPATKTLHHQMNVMMSRLDEQQRRWYGALEAKRHGYGGISLVQRITGLDAKTISNGIIELDADLQERPTDRIRLAGAGRPPIEKKRG